MKRYVKSFAFGALFMFLMGFCDCEDSFKKREILPGATQEGKNTFGCLVNGNLWVPKGYNGSTNLSIYYDPDYPEKGYSTFNLGGYRVIDGEIQSITLYSDSLVSTGIFDLNNQFRQSALFADSRSNCHYAMDSTVYHSGVLEITKLSIPQNIIAGTFEFTVATSGCDTVRVTDGRFDMEIFH